MENNASCGKTLFTLNFTFAWLATFLFYISSHLLLPTLPMYVLGLGGTEGDVGLVMSAFAMASVFMRLFAGQWVDRGGKKSLMLAGALVYVASAALYVVVAQVKGLVAVRFLHGLGIGMYSTAASSLISDSVPHHRRGEGLGYFMLATSLAMAVGPVVGVGMVERLSYRALFVASGVLAGIVVICTLLIAIPPAEATGVPFQRARGGWPGKRGYEEGACAGCPDRSRRRGAGREVFASIASLFGLEALFPSVTLGLGSATYGSIASFLAVYASSRGIRNPGVFFTTFALSMFATRTFAGKISDRHGRASVIAPGLAAIALGMATLAGATTLASFVLAAVIYGIGFSVMQPTITALTVDYVPPGRRGTALGTLLAMYDVGVALGGVVAGWVAERLPLHAVYWCMSGVGVLGLIIFLGGYRRYCVTRSSAMALQGALADEARSGGQVRTDPGSE